MKYLIAIPLMLLALIPPVIAEQENLILGPYEVSFDLGIEDLTNWVVNEPIKSESMDGNLTFAKYSANSGTLTESQFYSELKRLGRSPSIGYATIQITQYNSTEDESVNGTKTMIQTVVPRISKRIIDGRNGYIGSRTTGTVTSYVADWWVENNTSALITSTFPWDEGTLSLLKTIHVEKINETSQ